MRILLEWIRRFLGTLHWRRRDADLEEELRLHLELAAEDAGRAGRIRAGGLSQTMDALRDQGIVRWLDDLVRDLSYALRALRRSPGFTMAAVLALALGIGANTLAFSIIYSVLVRDLPYPESGRIVMVWFEPKNDPSARTSATFPNYFAVRDRNRVFESVGASFNASASISTSADDAAGEMIPGQRFHATLLRVLGIRPMLGGWFNDADDPRTAPGKIILSYGLWQRRFGGTPDVIGRSIHMDGEDTTVIGVMPEGFEFFDSAAEYWTPGRWSETTLRSPNRFLTVAARLKPGVTLEQAQAEMNGLAAALARELPQTNDGWGIRLEPIHEAYTAGVRGPLLLLQGIVALVLLIACANVAGLLLAQASTRQRELALRCALGSSRRRILRQLVTESILLSAIGGACGVVLAVAGLRLFMAQNPQWLPRAGSVTLDGGVLAFAVIVSAASGLLFGLLPAVRASRLPLFLTIKSVSAGTGGLSHQRLRGALVSGQVALAMVLLTSAGLLVNSFVRLALNRPGINTSGLLTFQMKLARNEFVRPTGSDAQGFFTLEFSPRTNVIFDEIRERVAAIPGVQSVAASVVAPATRSQFRFRVAKDTVPLNSAGAEEAAWFPISPAYFKTLGIPVTRGREFTPQDSLGSTQVAIINEKLARTLWPGESPLGREIAIDFINDPPRRVAGVVADVLETNEQFGVAPQVFVPEAQLPLASRGWFLDPRLTMTYVVRSSLDSQALVGNLRAAVGGVYGNQPIYNVRTLEQAITEHLAPRRQLFLLVGVFSGIAAILALVGIYGLVAYSVGQRTREIGIRRALGANAGTIMSLVLRQGLLLTSIGVAAGVTASLGTTRVFENLLWGVSPTDPATFAAVIAGLSAAALLACYVPARRALGVNPMVALRND